MHGPVRWGAECGPCTVGESCSTAHNPHTRRTRTVRLHDGRSNAPVVQRVPDGEAERSRRRHLRLRWKDPRRLPGGGAPNENGEPEAAAAAGPGLQTRDTTAQSRYDPQVSALGLIQPRSLGEDTPWGQSGVGQFSGRLTLITCDRDRQSSSDLWYTKALLMKTRWWRAASSNLKQTHTQCWGCS